MRRGVGVAAIKQSRSSTEKFKDKKTEIEDSSVEQLQVQLEKLRDKLEWFAAKHQNVLKTDPLFRQEFIQMCATIGVDPLASSKGFWTEFLGVGTFYYQLAVQAIEIVLSGAAYHGGVMRLQDLWKQLVDSRSSYLVDSKLSRQDVVQAFQIMSPIGKSCGVIRSGITHFEEQFVVFCVPEELSNDATDVIQLVAQSGKCSFYDIDLEYNLKWTRFRAKSAVKTLLREGIIWLDNNDQWGNTHYEEGEDPIELRLYWVPGLFFEIFDQAEAEGKNAWGNVDDDERNHNYYEKKMRIPSYGQASEL